MIDMMILLVSMKSFVLKTGITISHEDTQGSFILERFNNEDLEWVKDAKRK